MLLKIMNLLNVNNTTAFYIHITMQVINEKFKFKNLIFEAI